ncbi:diguanylate cyclase [Lutibaculum baratangense]|uniref:diguanylate cyclase n=1 Tax=Lutibaculum baratangense AMV1 TaxID=631454 RepID=V4RDF9_9HYPH|nr:diguanylate cyclase [Lutibaculum baratangense]ESR24196.1 hypothetical protein N177_2645 [Lutibaculum baratangense AMV1]
MSPLQILASLAGSAGLMALLALTFGTLERSRLPGWSRSLAAGLMFGFVAVVAMLTPVIVMDQVVIDGRSVIVGLGAAYGGPLAGLVAAVVAALFRYFQIGGPGAFPGTIGIFLAALLGWAWMRFSVAAGRPRFHQMAIGGFVISQQFLVAWIIGPHVAAQMIATVYPLLLLVSVAGAVVLGTLVERERRLIDAERRLEQAALRDSLTGLSNRRDFEQELIRARSGPGGAERSVAMIFLDLDDFKKINDRYGHAAGDEALRVFGGILGRHAAERQTVARIGGEEFAILLPDHDLPEACRLADGVMEALRGARVEYGSAAFSMTASGGVACFSTPLPEVDDMLRAADEALYEAKHGGRDRVVVAAGPVAA